MGRMGNYEPAPELRRNQSSRREVTKRYAHVSPDELLASVNEQMKMRQPVERRKSNISCQDLLQAQIEMKARSSRRERKKRHSSSSNQDGPLEESSSHRRPRGSSRTSSSLRRTSSRGQLEDGLGSPSSRHSKLGKSSRGSYSSSSRSSTSGNKLDDFLLEDSSRISSKKNGSDRSTRSARSRSSHSRSTRNTSLKDSNRSTHSRSSHSRSSHSRSSHSRSSRRSLNDHKKKRRDSNDSNDDMSDPRGALKRSGKGSRRLKNVRQSSVHSEGFKQSPKRSQQLTEAETRSLSPMMRSESIRNISSRHSRVSLAAEEVASQHIERQQEVAMQTMKARVPKRLSLENDDMFTMFRWSNDNVGDELVIDKEREEFAIARQLESEKKEAPLTVKSVFGEETPVLEIQPKRARSIKKHHPLLRRLSSSMSQSSSDKGQRRGSFFGKLMRRASATLGMGDNSSGSTMAESEH